MSNWPNTLQPVERLGKIEQCIGLKLVASGPPQAFVGELCDILDNHHHVIMSAEVIGFDQGKVILMPYSKAPISMGLSVRASGHSMSIAVGEELIGRIINAFGQALDNGKALRCQTHMPLYRDAMNPLQRERITQRLNTGIQAIDGLMPIGKGQRIGLFAGSGVGKSVLLGMITRHIESDINVIALIGERGREVGDFIHQYMDDTTLQKSIVIVACSDEFALARKQAVFTATAIAEYFCQQGKNVMLFMDSITRLAMAQRDIGLSLGEPPTARGYTPSVFSLLPGIIERAGNFKEQGSITALYTVLVEGDDFNEPIADTMRSLLDGHIVLTRDLAHQGHYPAIDVLQSISRLSHQLVTHQERTLIKQIIDILALYQKNRDLIELGAWQKGHNDKLDYAILRIDAIKQLLMQAMDDSLALPIVYQRMEELLQ